jgi:hypothetical protein
MALALWQGKDFGGPLPPGFVLRSVLQTANVLQSASAQNKAAQMKKAAAPRHPLMVAAN